MEGDVQTRRVVHLARAMAVGHVCVAVAAIVMVAVLGYAGTRPNAGFEGLFALFGVVLAIPTALFAVAALHCVRLSFREPPEGVTGSAVLGATEGALGVAFAAGVAVSGAPGSSPLILPAAILLVLGLTTAWLAVFRLSRTHRSAAMG